MIPEYWAYFAAILMTVGAVFYVVATLRGRARPNRITWSLWAAAPLIAFLAQLDGGVGAPAALTAAAALGPLLVLAASLLVRRGTGRITVFDVVCGAISVLALIIWLGLGDTAAAVVVSVIADAAAASPTVRKAWREPHTENATFYVLAGIAAVITLLTVKVWSVSSTFFVLYMVALTIVILAILIARRGAQRTRAVKPTA